MTDPLRFLLEVIDTPQWMQQAACKGMDPDLFYPGKGECGKGHPSRAVCAECPVRQECLEYALETEERFGFWGGKSEKQRQRMRSERRKVAACGTQGGYQRHRYAGEPQCPACLAAHSRYNMRRATTRAGTAAIGKPDGKYARNRARGWCSRCSAGNHSACIGCACACGQAETA